MATKLTPHYEWLFTPKIILEEDAQGVKRMRVEGDVSKAGETTGNGRRYGLPIWQKHIGDKQSSFQKSVAERKVLGMLEHPESEPNLEKVSHLWESANLLPTGTVRAKALVLETPSGKILRELFEVGVPVGVSSRGEGSTVLADDGVTEDVQEDYELETWDFVHTPALESARAAPVAESLKNKGRKEKAEMGKELERAKQVATEAEAMNLSASGLPELTALHIKVIEAMMPLTSLEEDGAAELRGRLAGLASQISRVIGETSKTAGDKVAETFNQQYPDAMSAVTALVDSLVKQTEKLTKELGETKGAEGSDTHKKLQAAMAAGESLVKRANKMMQENTKLKTKLALARNLLDKVMEAVRAKGLKKQVEVLVTKIPGLRHVEEELLRSKTSKELGKKVQSFKKLIESTEKPRPKSGSETRTSRREPLPPKNTRKRGGMTETKAPASKPKSLFGRLKARGL